MRAFKALWGKELRAHGVAVLLMLLGLAALLGFILLGKLAEESKTSVLETIPFFLLFFVSLEAVILSKRLIVDEYQSHTHEFLQSLPLQRWQVVTLKYVIGLFLLLVVAGALLGGTVAVAVRAEPVSGQFAGYLALRSLGYILFLWGLCFCIAFTGRFRQPLAFGGFIVLMGVSLSTGLTFFELPPLQLVDPAFMPFQRTVFPTRAFVLASVTGVLLTATGFFLAIWSEGHMVNQLAGRLSQREKSALGMLFVAVIIASVVVDGKKPKEPYEFREVYVLRSSVTGLEILYYQPNNEEAAQRLFDWLDERLLALERELGMANLPPARITLSEDLDGVTVEGARMTKNDGVLLRCNFTAADFERGGVGALMVHELIDGATRGRGHLDPQHWFLDGFSVWWVGEQFEARTTEAVWMTREGVPDQESVTGWSALADRLGERPAESFALTGILALEERVGREKVVGLARSLYARRVHQDVRESFYTWTHPMSSVFRSSTGTEYESLFPAWRDWLEVQRSKPEVRRRVLSFGDPSPGLKVTQDEIEIKLSLPEAPPRGTTWSLVHSKLSAADFPVTARELKREDRIWTVGAKEQKLSLVQRYSPGDRVLVGIEIQYPGCKYPLRVSTQRRDIP